MWPEWQTILWYFSYLFHKFSFTDILQEERYELMQGFFLSSFVTCLTFSWILTKSPSEEQQYTSTWAVSWTCLSNNDCCCCINFNLNAWLTQVFFHIRVLEHKRGRDSRAQWFGEQTKAATLLKSFAPKSDFCFHRLSLKIFGLFHQQ
jgi:hypothetical protein